MQACHLCGTVFDIEAVQPKPFKRCPGCGAPLDADAVEHTFVESANPSDPKDATKLAHKAQLHADVAEHNRRAIEAKRTPSTLASRIAEPAPPAEIIGGKKKTVDG